MKTQTAGDAAITVKLEPTYPRSTVQWRARGWDFAVTHGGDAVHGVYMRWIR